MALHAAHQVSDAHAYFPYVPTPAGPRVCGIGGGAKMQPVPTPAGPGLRARKDANTDCSSRATTFSPDVDLLLRRIEQKSLGQHRADQRGLPVEPQPRPAFLLSCNPLYRCDITILCICHDGGTWPALILIIPSRCTILLHIFF